MKIKIFWACFFISSAHADESLHFFFGVKGGYHRALDYSYQHSDPEGSILGLYGGLKFSPYLSWDLGYQYHDGLKANATSVNVDNWFIESAFRYDWYPQDNLSLYGRLGAAYWSVEKTQLSSNRIEATGFSPLGEVGFSYHFNPNFRLSTGYQHINSIGKSNTGKYDSHGLLVSLTYVFGGVGKLALVEAVRTPIIEDAPVQETNTLKIPPQTQTLPPNTWDGLFGFDSIELNYDFIELLIEISSVLNTYPKAYAVIVGHTDSIGSELHNQKLSEQRAQAVANKLIKLGVTSTQIEWRGEGESQPAADNNTAEGRAINRRVEITIPNFQF